MNKKYFLIIILVVIAYLLLKPIIFSSHQNNSAQNFSSSAQKTSSMEDSATENATYGHVHALWVNPQDGSLLMGTHHGVFKSTDGGKTFTKVDLKGDVNADDFMNFTYDSTNKIIYAGGHDVGVVKSTDGITWTKTDSGIKGTDIHALVISPLDSNRLYAFSVDNGVFGTKDGAKSWYRIDDGPTNPSVRAFGYMATPSSMDRGMKTDTTTNIGYLWAGTSGGLYSSFACFCGWTKTNGISDNAIIYTLAPDPVNKSSMFAGTKDGIYKTADEGKTFIQVNSEIKNVAAITFEQSNPKTLYAATSDGIVFKSIDSGGNWSKVNE